jgi:hypothetical protein
LLSYVPSVRDTDAEDYAVKLVSQGITNSTRLKKAVDKGTSLSFITEDDLDDIKEALNATTPTQPLVPAVDNTQTTPKKPSDQPAVEKAKEEVTVVAQTIAKKETEPIVQLATTPTAAPKGASDNTASEKTLTLTKTVSYC